MNDETPNNEGKRSARRLRKPAMPEPVEAAWFALQERLIWPLQDRFAALGPETRRTALLGGGALALVAVLAVAALALSSVGGSSSPTRTVSEAPAPREPLISSAPDRAQPKPEKKAPPRETLHGAAPVFSPPSSANKGGEKTGSTKPAGKATNSESAESEASDGSGSTDSSSTESTAASPTPDAARISSDPKKSAGSDSKTTDGGADGSADAARATVPDGPPAGPEALKVAREFAKGFVVYETGGEASGYRDAFEIAATPRLARALLQRPPKQPAGVKVPRAKVLNVVAGPSQGSVYKVSVSLLRVGVTSELRLDMEKVKTAGKAAGKSGKSAEWRVTNVLG